MLVLGCMTAALPAGAQSTDLQGSGALVRQDQSDCGNTNVSDSDPSRVGGNVMIVQTAAGATTAIVQITSGTANTSYNFYWKCQRGLGAVQTDASGAGTASFAFQTTPGATLTFDMYPDGAPSGNKFQSVRITPTPVAYQGQGALVRQDQSDCGNTNVSDSDPSRVGGNVTIVQSAAGATTAIVQITHGTANTRYNFYWKCQRGLGSVQTDASGAGTAGFVFQATAGTTLTFDMYPDGAPAGHKFQSMRITPTASGPSGGGYSDAQKAIARRYAPMVWLAQGEQWLPSSIEYFAANVRARCNGQVVAENILTLTASQLPAGAGDGTCNFVTHQALSGPYDRPAFVTGQNPLQTSVPIYVFLYPDTTSSDPGSFYAQYMTFYPYNFGKNACMTLAPYDNCLGSRMEMGDHIADWELLTIRFAQGQPSALHVGSHGNDLPDTAWNFFPPTWTKGGARSDGPVLVWESTHPVVFSATGSHGVYGWEGKHNYQTLPTGDKLNDYTSRGTRWETWNNVIFADDPRYNVLLNVYEGRWGNPHMGQNACDASPVPDVLCGPLGIPRNEYQLNDGPSLPNRQRDKNEIHPF
jgi:hypothetical protein